MPVCGIVQIGPSHPVPHAAWTSAADRAANAHAAPFDPLPGSVPFWRALEATNRVAGQVTPPASAGASPDALHHKTHREPDRVDLHAPGAPASTGAAKLGEVSPAPDPQHQPAAKPACAQDQRQQIARTTGRGNIIDVTI